MWPHEVEPWFYSWYRDSLDTLDEVIMTSTFLTGESARRRGDEVKEVERQRREEEEEKEVRRSTKLTYFIVLVVESVDASALTRRLSVTEDPRFEKRSEVTSTS